MSDVDKIFGLRCEFAQIAQGASHLTRTLRRIGRGDSAQHVSL